MQSGLTSVSAPLASAKGVGTSWGLSDTATMSSTDALTGLPDREAFLSEMSRLTRAGEPFSLLMLDLDNFKAVNVRAFPEQADRLLRRTGEAIVTVSPAGAMVFRYGGDEFAVVVATAATHEVVELGALLCAAVAAIEVPSSDDLHFPTPTHLACSIGAACYPVDGPTADDLVLAAEMAQSQVKRAGGGQVAGANPPRDPPRTRL